MIERYMEGQEKTKTQRGPRVAITGDRVGTVEIKIGSAEVASNASMDDFPPPGMEPGQLRKEKPVPAKTQEQKPSHKRNYGPPSPDNPVTTSVSRDTRINKEWEEEQKELELSGD